MVLDLEVVNISPEIEPEIPEITRSLQEKGYKWLEQKVTYALCQTKMVNCRKCRAEKK